MLNLEDGKVSQSVNTPGSIAQYECQKGYALFGNAVRQCLQIGSWSGFRPKCQRKSNNSKYPMTLNK